jgi:acetyl-CoA carboxylase biotin carboxyl carrier protein
MNLDLEELAAIIEQLDKTEFTDFLYEQGDLRLHVRRGGHFEESQAAHTAAAVSAAPTVAAAPVSAPVNTAAPAAGLDPNNLPAGHVAVTSPMLGTFYGAPKPGEARFAAVGDSVDADSVLCIVEVMKLMNSVTAGSTGEIAGVFVADGDLVEFGQTLFALKVAA